MENDSPYTKQRVVQLEEMVIYLEQALAKSNQRATALEEEIEVLVNTVHTFIEELESSIRVVAR
jgi:hypothetical protein